MVIPPIPTVTLTVRQRSLEVIDYVVCLAYICLAFAVAWALAFGPPRLHQSTAVELVSGLGLSWAFISIVFTIYGALLCNRYTRVGGWIVGVLLYGYYLASVFSSVVVEGNQGSAFAVAAAAVATLSQMAGLARSMVAAEWRNGAS